MKTFHSLFIVEYWNNSKDFFFGDVFVVVTYFSMRIHNRARLTRNVHFAVFGLCTFIDFILILCENEKERKNNQALIGIIFEVIWNNRKIYINIMKKKKNMKKECEQNTFRK